MLKYIEGDIFSSPAQVLVNTVNTVGVMGKGIALEYKKRYPEMFNQYKLQCDRHKLVVGKLILWYGIDHWILQFPTKEHWRNPSKLEYIERGLMTFVNKYADYNISSIAFPKLGCGNGELDWNQVKPLMEKYLKNLPIDVYIYLGVNKDVMPEHKDSKRMSEFLKANAKDLSYTGLKDEIVYNSLITPIEFEFQGKRWNVYINEDKAIVFEAGDASYIIPDENAHRIWDEIVRKKIFDCGDGLEDNIFCDLLAFMGYINHVKIVDGEKGTKQQGYQVDEGKGRMFLVRGYDDI